MPWGPSTKIPAGPDLLQYSIVGSKLNLAIIEQLLGVTHVALHRFERQRKQAGQQHESQQ
jgi:hypothetical protein